MARALGAGLAAFLVIGASAWRVWGQSSAPGLSVARTGTNQVTLTVTNGVPSGLHEIWWTEFLDGEALSLTNGAWEPLDTATTGETNSIFDLGDLDTGFFTLVGPGQAALPSVVGISGQHLTIGGVNETQSLVGVNDTVAFAFAVDAYVNGHTAELGYNMNFPGFFGYPNNIKIQVSNVSQFFYAYFWFCAHYGIRLVRFSCGDSWATGLVYQAWLHHPAQYYQLLDILLQRAWSRGIYIDLNLAGSQAYPLYAFGAADSVLDLNSVAGHAYANYLAYLQGTMNHCDASIYTSAIFSYDVWNEPDHSSVVKGYWHTNKALFHAWASRVANDTTVMSTHIVEMGTAWLGNGLYGWTQADFNSATGTTGFDVCEYHYYASVGGTSNNYLITQPVGWANAVNKPVMVSEVANNSGSLHRYTWWETTFKANVGGAFCAMVMTGTSGYPYTGPYPIWGTINSPAQR
jgi:hypothetical protein